MKKAFENKLPAHAVRRSDGTVPQIKLETSIDRITNATSRGLYDGKELGRTCVRPGAYDYLACKSRGFI